MIVQPMPLDKVYENLCHKDPLYPFFDALYGEDEKENLVPREDCSCDNCFYNRDPLALEVLRLQSVIEWNKKIR